MDRRIFLRNSLLAAAGVPGSALAQAQGKRQFTIDLTPGAVGVGAKGEDLIELAAAHGFESIQPNGGFLAGLDSAQRKDFAAKVTEKGLKWGSAGLPVDFRKDADTFRSGVEKLSAVAAALQEVGATRVNTWLMPKHDSLTYVANFRQHKERLGEIAGVLDDHGLRFGLEYVGTWSLWTGAKYSFIHSMAETKDLLSEIGKSNMGFVLDSWHWYNAGETAEDILTLKNSDIVACDLNDAPTGLSKKELNDTSRELPAATGVIDTAPFLNALVKVGYDGPVRAEPFNQPLRKLDDAPAAKATAEAIRKAFDQAGV